MSGSSTPEKRRDGGGGGGNGGGVPDVVLVGGLVLLVGVATLTWTATGAAGWIVHGAWPEGVTFTRTGTAVRSLLTAPGDVAGAWPEADPDTLPDAGVLWLVFLTQVAALFSTVLLVAMRVERWRLRRAARGARGARGAGGAAWDRPGTRPEPRPQPRAQAPVPQPASVPVPEVPVAAPAPEPPEPPEPVQRVKTPVDPVPAVLRAPEGLVVVDPNGRLWEKTSRPRGRRGPVHVYDPGHVTDAPVRLRWAPQRGCEDMAVARRRAAALLAPVRPSEPVFRLDAETAGTLLRCYLHAAALAGEPVTHVLRWAHGKGESEPAKILRNHARAAGGASMELESALTTHPGRRDAGLTLIARALAGLDQLHIRQCCSPGRVDALALDNLGGEGGTLYVVGEHRETAGLRGALVEAVTAAQPSLTVVRG